MDGSTCEGEGIKGERLMLFVFCSFFVACVSLTIMLFFFQKSQPLENLLNSSC